MSAPEHVIVLGRDDATRRPIAWLAPREDPATHEPYPGQTRLAVIPLTFNTKISFTEMNRRNRILRRILEEECDQKLPESKRFTTLVAISSLIGCNRYSQPDPCLPPKWMLRLICTNSGMGVACRMVPIADTWKECRPFFFEDNLDGRSLHQLLDDCMERTSDCVQSDDHVPYHAYLQSACFVGWRYTNFAKTAPSRIPA